MLFLTYRYNNKESVGILNSDETKVIGLKAILGKNAPNSMVEFIDKFSEEWIDILRESKNRADGLDIEDVDIQSPIPEPIRNVICVGKNYKDHIKEVAQAIDNEREVPKFPVYFTKMIDRAPGNGDDIPSHSDITNSLDYEAELAIVIGKDGRDIPYNKAEEYIFGYTILNDISVRDVQRRHLQWFRGKSFDGTCPMGPYILHKSAVNYPPKLNIQSKVNGELRQNSNTENFIFDIGTIISDFSKGITLRKGDIIATGTPSGVGMGFVPPKYLKSGDVVECYIEGIGVLKNTIRDMK